MAPLLQEDRRKGIAMDDRTEEEKRKDQSMAEAMREDQGITLKFPVSPETVKVFQKRYGSVQDEKGPAIDRIILKTAQGFDSALLSTLGGEEIGRGVNVTVSREFSLHITLWARVEEFLTFDFYLGGKVEKFVLGSPDAEPPSAEAFADWQEWAREVNARNERLKILPVIRTCPVCGERFMRRDPRQVFHSPACANRGHARRHYEKTKKSKG